MTCMGVTAKIKSFCFPVVLRRGVSELNQLKIFKILQLCYICINICSSKITVFLCLFQSPDGATADFERLAI